MFLKDDQEHAEKELSCFYHCAEEGENAFKEENYTKAACYFENATRSLNELGKMKTAKQTFDHSWFEIKQIEGQQEVDRVIANMRLGL